MTLEEATAALAADPAALVFAGRDLDSLTAAVVAFTDPAPERQGPVNLALEAVRKAVATATDTPARLAAVKDGIATLSGILATREAARAASAAIIADRDWRAAENWHAHQAAQARRERVDRATYPIFVNMRERINAVAYQVGDHETADAMSAALDALAADIAGHVDTLRSVSASALPAAA